jgi:hypothetical protein
MKKEPKRKTRLGLESQDDVSYLTGRRTPAEEEKQIRTPSPRRLSKGIKQARKGEEDGKDS